MGFFQKNETSLGKKRRAAKEYNDGITLRVARMKKHYSANEVAEDLSISKYVLLDIESGNFLDHKDVLPKLIEYLNLDLDISYVFQKSNSKKELCLI